MIDLANKLVVVTGGAGLIGSKFVEAVIASGGQCLIADLNVEKSLSNISLLEKKYGPEKAFHYALDITSKDSIQACLRYCDQNIGVVKALVNNAYPKTKDFGRDFFDVSYDTLCQNLNSHLGGYFLTSQVFADYFKNNGGGNIVNIASIYGCIAPKFDIYEGTKMANGPEYALIKSGVIHLTHFMAKRFKGMNIKVNCISPGGVEDGQPDSFLKAYADYCSSKGMLNPDDLSGTLVFLLSDNSKYVQGQNIIVDDGFTL